jgi:REP element-mobilizing transposase RayT
MDLERLRPPKDFVGFDPLGAFRNYERNLPHWRQPGATYFLTFRLNDSLPAEVLEDYQREQQAMRERIARELDRSGSVSESTFEDYEAFQLRTCRKIERVLDEGHGACPLKQPDLRQIVTDALLHFQGDRCEMHGLVIMPNHVHLVVQPLGDHQPEDLLHSWKRFASREINLRLRQEGQLWQHDTWNRIIRDETHWLKAMRYTLRNSERAHLWDGESTVWWDHRLMGDTCRVAEEVDDEPW